VTTVTGNQGIPSSAPIALETAVVKSWKAPIALGFFAVLSLVLFGIFGRTGTSTFRLSTDTDFFQIPPIPVDARPASIVTSVLLLLIAGWAAWLAQHARKVPLWLTALFAVLFLFTFFLNTLAEVVRSRLRKKYSSL